MKPAEPYCILIAALGGEGGGVLADWLVQCARAADLPVQSTSVPGVAQRTGATSYYVELLREAPAAGVQPVFALHPMPCRVEVVIASELLETARMIERGFVSPDRTVLVSSTHRVYTTLEKLPAADGRYDTATVLDAARATAQRCIAFDMEAATVEAGTVVSAVMFGALAGAGTLPWPRATCESVIRASGKGVEASLRGFALAFERAGVGGIVAPVQPAPGVDLPPALREAWSARLAAWPAELQTTAAHGALRCLEFQDAAYADLYLRHLQALHDANPRAGAALAEAARCLALWMSFEDVIRVADLKSRKRRFDKVHAEVAARPGEIVQVFEVLKPGIDELCGTLPRAWGAWLRATAQRRGWAGRLNVGLNVRSTGIVGFALLRLLASLKPLRRRSLRHAEEHEAIDAWVEAMALALRRAPDFALALAGLPAVLKGYGETHQRGRAQFARLWHGIVVPALAEPIDAAALPRATARLRDALREARATPDLQSPSQPARPPAAQPIRFIKKSPPERAVRSHP